MEISELNNGLSSQSLGVVPGFSKCTSKDLVGGVGVCAYDDYGNIINCAAL
jgi:hypothetical protein